MSQFLRKETELIVWEIALPALNAIGDLIVTQDCYGLYKVHHHLSIMAVCKIFLVTPS